MHKTKNRAKQAVKSFRAAVKAQPSYVTAWKYLGQSLLYGEEQTESILKQAKKAFQEAARMQKAQAQKPDLEVDYNLGVVALMSGDSATAEKKLRKSLRASEHTSMVTASWRAETSMAPGRTLLCCPS